jgi:opacity protein-like surface antigen
MRAVPLAALIVFTAVPTAVAQSLGVTAPDGLSVRGVATIDLQRFAADTTFGAIFGSATGALVGGGVLITHRHVFVEVTASRFKRTGERAFATEEEGFGLDVPVTVSITPIEVSAGYRFTLPRSSITPYAGGGLGIYRYEESSPSADAAEALSVSHAGWLLAGGAEFRLHRWIALGADLRYTNIPGILGQGGLSQAVNEKNLGGLAARFKVIFGR